jgi:hypothetical protein
VSGEIGIPEVDQMRGGFACLNHQLSQFAAARYGLGQPASSGRHVRRGMRIATRPYGGVWGDTTDATIAQIKGEIASLQRTIDNVIAEQGLRD